MAHFKAGIMGALLVAAGIASGTPAVALDDGVPKVAEDMALPSGEMIGDIVMPAGSAMDAKESIILGNGANAFGKIIAQVKAKQVKVMQFYKDNMPTQGWGLISEIQDDDITLTFQKPTRVAVIHIERGRTTDLTITVTPRN